MESLRSFLHSASIRKTSTSSASHIKAGEKLPRTQIGNASQHLPKEILDLYWLGVKGELAEIILNLHKWQKHPQFAQTILPDERPDIIHGYDTFLDQVSYGSRDFNARNRDPDGDTDSDILTLVDSKATLVRDKHTSPTYTDALKLRGMDLFAELESNFLKKAVMESINATEPLDVLHRRARMLLQSSQFLDIDKLIEHREPNDNTSSWQRPAPPQLRTSVNSKNAPIFIPTKCSGCQKIIRGSSYQAIRDEAFTLCETCYRKSHNGQADFKKMYKRCCLPTTPKSGYEYTVQAGIDEIKYAEAKYAATRGKADKGATLYDAIKKDEKKFQEEWRSFKIRNPTLIMGQNRSSALPNMDAIKSNSEFGTSHHKYDAKQESVPQYLRNSANNYPDDNVHMAVRFGPLIIENGLKNTHGDVLITSRDPVQLQILPDQTNGIQRSLLLAGTNERILYSQNRPRTCKRYQSMMKQVVGGAFCGFIDDQAEREIVDILIKESGALDSVRMTTARDAETLEKSTNRVLEKVRPYLSFHVERYMDSFINRLLDPRVKLRWKQRTNDCQTFCNNLIDYEIFGSLFAPSGVTRLDRLYLISFVCRPGAYIRETTKFLFDVPNGFMEEYLLRLRYGRHEESDIIDTLQEYWHDWGNFQGPIYPYQDVFPWDCTEAYGRDPTKCSECNISKHVWAFPFDSWSIATLNLSRGRQFYPPTSPITATDKLAAPVESNGVSIGLMTDMNWFQNRLTILLAQDTLLTTAAAMARTPIVHNATAWMHHYPDERMDRLKLGGIHRAQPFSHHFERGAYHHYYLSEWASLPLPKRIKAYEKLRDERAARTEVPTRRAAFRAREKSSSCGAAGACLTMLSPPPAGGDTCGTGCASSSGGGSGGGYGGGGYGGGGCGGGGCGGGDGGG